MTRVMYAAELADLVANNPQLAQDVKDNPDKLRELAQSPLQTDKAVYRLVVIALGLAVLIAAGGALWLGLRGSAAVPDALTAIGSAAVGALAGLLAPSPARSG